MILFIVIAVGIFIYTIFAKDYLIDSIKGIDEYNKDIEGKIRCGCTNYDLFFSRKYDKRDYESIPKIVFEQLLVNIVFNFVNAIIVFIISAIVVFAYPKTETQYSFNINSLKDNLVTSGKIYGSAFCIRGSIDGEVSYFFSRATDKGGGNIGHIPAKDSYIKYDEESKPYIEVHQTTHEFPDWLKKILWVEFLSSTSTEYYVIVVPEGTISVEGTYQIDMEQYANAPILQVETK